MSRTRKRILWTLVFGLAMFLSVVVMPIAFLNKAHAHDWYPMECCHQMDCAPADKIEYVNVAATPMGPFLPGTSAYATPTLSMVVTTKLGTVIVPPNFPRRESKDSRVHACMQPKLAAQGGGMRLICIFLPPAM